MPVRFPPAARLRALCSAGVLSFTACAAPLQETSAPKPEWDALTSQLLRAELRRDVDAEKISEALRQESPHHRALALRVLGRIESAQSATIAASLLKDSSIQVAQMAAFTLGQLPGAAAEEALVAGLKLSFDVPQQKVIRAALGRRASIFAEPPKWAQQPQILFEGALPQTHGASALTLGLLVKKHGAKYLNPVSQAFLISLLDSQEPEERYGAVYAMMYAANSAAAIHLPRALDDADPEVRANAVRGLGRAKATPGTLDAAFSDADWRVQVRLAEALGAIGHSSGPEDESRAATRLMRMLSRYFKRLAAAEDVLLAGRISHIVLTTLNSIDQLPEQGETLLQDAEKLFWKYPQVSSFAKPDVARIQCRVAFLTDRKLKQIQRVNSCGEGFILPWRRQQMQLQLRAHRGTAEDKEEIYRAAFHQDPKLRTLAAELIGEDTSQEASNYLLELLQSNDVHVVAMAALGLTQAKRKRPEVLVPRLAEALTRALAVKDPNPGVLVLDAIFSLKEAAAPLKGQLQGLLTDPRPAVRRRAAQALTPILGQLPEYRASMGEPVLPQARGKQAVRHLMQTTRGDLVIEIFPWVAPVAADVLTGLFEQGFYRGNSFHRVVSDFVIQWGCPRGDGHGGPGFAVLGVTSPLPFKRGTLGIATNGRDTGGSQLFIMHSHHPHLEGRYSLIGRVVEGIDVVDALNQDDLVLSVRRQD